MSRNSRRDFLAVAGAAAAFGFCKGFARDIGAARALPLQAVTAASACIVRPQQTEGPYFVDEHLERSDIRQDPATGATKPGVPLGVTFRVTKMSAAGCVPFAKAVIDLWQCDALGEYSDVYDRRLGFNTKGQRFLRGHQLTDDAGAARFTTIFPGWYPGRAVHLHFKIRTAPTETRAHAFTSQLYFDDALTTAVHDRAPYNTHGQRTAMNSRDRIYRRGGDHLLLSLTPDAGGYAGVFDIGLEL